MPQIKKKGAIFAIYADSPVKPPTAPPRASALAKSAVASTSGENAPPGSVIKVERRSSLKKITRPRSGSTSRKPLASVQSRPLSIRTEASKSDLKAEAAKTSLKPASKATSAVLPGPAPSALPKSASKRQLPSPTPSPREPTFSSKNIAATTTSASLARTPHRTPAKKARQTSVPFEDKENCAPAHMDSPASRTRSKTRASPPSSVEQLERQGEALVGDGRGAMSLRKGREMAKLLKSGSVKGKDLSVLADGALGDVSEAYGASGTEPEGFKAVRLR